MPCNRSVVLSLSKRRICPSLPIRSRSPVRPLLYHSSSFHFSQSNALAQNRVNGITEIAEQILLTYNYDLAFRVMQDYRLALQNIYASAISKIAAMKQNAKVLDLLKHIKVTLFTMQFGCWSLHNYRRTGNDQ